MSAIPKHAWNNIPWLDMQPYKIDNSESRNQCSWKHKNWLNENNLLINETFKSLKLWQLDEAIHHLSSGRWTHIEGSSLSQLNSIGLTCVSCMHVMRITTTLNITTNSEKFKPASRIQCLLFIILIRLIT